MTIQPIQTSILTALKVALITYFNNQTGIDWDAPKDSSETFSGWVNVYEWELIDRNEGVKIHKPFAKGRYNNYKIQLRLTKLSNDFTTLDNELLDVANFIVFLIELIENVGVLVNHPNWHTPTGLKGLRVESIKKEIKQLNTGDQEIVNDELYQGEINLYCILKA